jgi:hypothetical protein
MRHDRGASRTVGAEAAAFVDGNEIIRCGVVAIEYLSFNTRPAVSRSAVVKNARYCAIGNKNPGLDGFHQLLSFVDAVTRIKT